MQEHRGHFVAAMDSHFSRLLIALGFPFVPVGPVNEAVSPPRRDIWWARQMEHSIGAREGSRPAVHAGTAGGADQVLRSRNFSSPSFCIRV